MNAYHDFEFKPYRKPTSSANGPFSSSTRRIYLVCPTELKDLADKYDELQEIGCEAFVSCDTHFVHKPGRTLRDYQGDKILMLADPTGALARDFDVMIEDKGLAERGTFIKPRGRDLRL
ncbi:MAG: redoxin domain-containing protein [Cloacibacillus evryensis]